jgi:rod shape-determining protein MreC
VVRGCGFQEVPSSVIRLSIPVRQALAKLTLPVLIAAAFGLMLLGKADALLAERARMALADALAPIFGILAEPLASARAAVDNGRHLLTIYEDNATLRAENEQLRRWQSVALALDAENATLKANLHWIPDPAPSYLTAHVVADAGGVYARAVLLSAGPNHSIAKGQIALDDRGLVGRVTELGARSARVLLITDMNSRIPVILESSRARAMLTGTNGPRPRLMYWPEGVQPGEGERVVTSAEAGAFPAGLPVGTVHYTSNNVPEVEPLARLDRLEIVRLFDYGLRGVLPPEASTAHVADHHK